MGSYDLAIKCPRLRKPNYGMISPTDCAETKKLYGAQCAFACNPGFQLQGPSIRYTNHAQVQETCVFIF